MRKFALLVGVEDYRDKMISRLNFARAGATALAERLRDRCGFDQVRVLADDTGLVPQRAVLKPRMGRA